MGYPKAYAVKLDDDGAGNQYVGFAKPGTASATSGWALMKIATSGLDLDITWASGDSNMDKVWDNRLSETYS